MKKLNKKGFTLIEIIVVVVVLAVLMAVAVPSVLKYVNEADNAKYMAQGRSVMNIAQTEVVKAYVGDNKIDATELGKIQGDAVTIYNEDGLTVTKVEIYTVLPTITESNGSLTIADGTKLAATNAGDPLPVVKAVKCEIGGKKIIAVLNDKVYVGK